jgi:cytochrome c-type biogenesis protein CcsB
MGILHQQHFMQLEIILFWFSLFAYVLAFCCGIIGFLHQRPKQEKAAAILLWLAFAAHSATAVAHWVISGHAPVTDTYELNLTGTWFTVLLFLLFRQANKIDRTVSLAVIPLCFLIMGYGYLAGIEIKPMGPAFQSPWLVVHVIFAWLAFGSYAIATGKSLFLLLQKGLPGWRPAMRFGTAAELDLSSYRFVILGFINHAIMLVSGAIWAKKLWGTYWSWDPLETWSLISFLFYAFYLHARSFLGWKMTKAAWLCIAGLAILAVSFWGVGLFGPTIHPGP